MWDHVSFGFGMFLGLMAGLAVASMAVRGQRSDAVKNHAAEYVCDPQTGRTRFQWLTAPLPEQM